MEGAFHAAFIYSKENATKLHSHPSSEVIQSTVELKLHSATQPCCNRGMEKVRGNWKDGNAWGI